MNLGYILTGGFLAGYRTKIISILLILDVVGKYLLGDIGLMVLLQQNWTELLGAIGLMTASVHKPA